MFKRTIDTVCDNAMLYKDITQWLRNRTFLALFFGLLAISEMVGVICVSVPSEAGEMGPIAFSVLSGVLALFGFVIAVMGLTLTYREIASRTFELYALSGMSLERMMSGKLVSMLAQFFFCFCCIVPFMFFSFLLGGLDFYLIFAVTLCIALAFPPVCLFSLFVALHFRFKGIGMFVWGGGIVLAILVVGYTSLIFIITIAMSGHATPFSKPLDFFKALLDFDGDAWNGLSVFLLFYGQVCLLLFYLCCNAISPAQDSREHFVKCFAFTLTVTALTTLVCIDAGRETLISGGVGAFVVSCAIGLCYFYRTFDVPLMVAKRHRQRRPGLWRALGFLFAPGSWGTLRTIVLIALAACAFTGLAVSLKPGLLGNTRALSYALLPCQAPFFLVFPAGFLLNFDRYRERPALLRNAVLIWWVVIGTALLLVVATFSDAQRGGDLGSSQAAMNAVCQLLAYILSPVSAVGIGLPSYTDVGTSLPWFRLVLGVLGVYLAIRSLSRTAYRNRVERDKALGAVLEGMPPVAAPPLRGGPEL